MDVLIIKSKKKKKIKHFLKYFWVQEYLVETIYKIQAYIMYIFFLLEINYYA